MLALTILFWILIGIACVLYVITLCAFLIRSLRERYVYVYMNLASAIVVFVADIVLLIKNILY